MKEKKNSVRQSKWEPQDIVKDVIWNVFVAVIAFAWLLLMLLIVSFVTSGYLHFQFDHMVIISVIGGVLMLIFKMITTIRKYTK